MPCNDSSSSITIKIDHQDRMMSFDFAKITCGREITGGTDFQKYCKGKTMTEILKIPFSDLAAQFKSQDEEKQFIMYLEWDAVRSALAQYLGIDDPDIDKARCKITAIDYADDFIEIAEVILPPKELPKILPCGLAKN